MVFRGREIINAIAGGKGQDTFVKSCGGQITALAPWSPRAEKHGDRFTVFGSRRKQHSMSKQMWDLVAPRQTKLYNNYMYSLTGVKMDFWKGKNLHGAETRTRRHQGEDKRAAQEDETLEEEDLDGAAISRPDPLEKMPKANGLVHRPIGPTGHISVDINFQMISTKVAKKIIRQARGSMAVHDFLELVVPEEMLEQLKKIDASVWDVVEDARGFIDPKFPFSAGDSNWTPIVDAKAISEETGERYPQPWMMATEAPNINANPTPHITPAARSWKHATAGYFLIVDGSIKISSLSCRRCISYSTGVLRQSKSQSTIYRIFSRVRRLFRVTARNLLWPESMACWKQQMYSGGRWNSQTVAKTVQMS